MENLASKCHRGGKAVVTNPKGTAYMSQELSVFDAIKPYDTLLRFAPFELDRLNTLRALMTYPMINWVSQFFSRTRDGGTQLYFVRYCREIIEEYDAEISAEEREAFDRELIHYELSAYDRLNWWQEYVNFFEETRNQKPYTIAYAGWADHPGMEGYLSGQSPAVQCQDPDEGKFE